MLNDVGIIHRGRKHVQCGSASGASLFTWRDSGGMPLGPAGEDRGVQAAARSELSLDDAPDGIACLDDVMEHLVDGIFIEDAEIAVGE